MHGYRKKTSAPREVPSQLLTATGKAKYDPSLSRDHDGDRSNRAKSAPLSSRRRSIAASSNEDSATRGRMMGVGPSTTRSKSFSRKSSSYPKLLKESTAKPKSVRRSTVDELNKCSPRLSMESPNAMKVVHHFESSRTVDGLKQSNLALPSGSGETYGGSVLVKASPLTRRNRYQLDNKTIEGLKQSVHSLSHSPGEKNEVSDYVKESLRTKIDRQQLDNRTMETLKQSFQTLANSPLEKGPKSSKEKELLENSLTRKRVDTLLLQEGPSNQNIGHQQEITIGVDGRSQNNFIALPNSTARLARRTSMTRNSGNP